MNTYLSEEELTAYADAMEKVEGFGDIPITRHLSETQRMQLQTERCFRCARNTYVDTQDLKKYFRAMYKELRSMKIQITNIENKLKGESAAEMKAKNPSKSMSLIPVPEGVAMWKRTATEPRFVPVEREARVPGQVHPSTAPSKVHTTK